MIWIIQSAFIGDCVLSLPFLARALALYPDQKFQVVTTETGADVFRMALARGLRTDGDRVTVRVFRKRGVHGNLRGMRALVRELKMDGAPEVVFCLQRSFRSGLLAFLSDAPVRVGFASGAASFFYTDAVKRDWDSGRSEIEKNLDLLRQLKTVDPWSPRHAPSLLKAAPDVSIAHDAPVAMSLGSPWPTKRWPIENAADLAQRLTSEGNFVHLIGDPSAVELAAELKRRAPSLLIKDLTGKTSVGEWIDEIARAKLLVSGDSAAVHIASDLRVPVLALFGPTLPEFGFAPWRPDSAALGVAHLYCRPCDIHGPKRCPEGHHRCLKDLSGEAAHRQVLRLLK